MHHSGLGDVGIFSLVKAEKAPGSLSSLGAYTRHGLLARRRKALRKSGNALLSLLHLALALQLAKLLWSQAKQTARTLHIHPLRPPP